MLQICNLLSNINWRWTRT